MSGPCSKSSLAFSDRLKPLCSQQISSSPASLGVPPTQTSPPQMQLSPSQLSARAIVRKYRRRRRQREYSRLRSCVPEVKDKQEASQCEILEATIKYIDELHRRLLDRINETGVVPKELRQAQQNTQASKSFPSQHPSRQHPKMSESEMRSLLGDALRPRMQRSLRERRRTEARQIAKAISKWGQQQQEMRIVQQEGLSR